MDNSFAHSEEPASLRERKRLHVLATVQEQALLLFSEHGYYEVTVEQIAKAAGISRSTLFRHFATKEAMVLYDSLDSPLTQAFRRQPATYSVVRALRETLRAIFSQPEANGLEGKRQALIRSVPELRAVALDKIATNIASLAVLIAERTKRSENDIAVRTLASALTGIALDVFLAEDEGDQLARFDAALTHLETGFDL